MSIIADTLKRLQSQSKSGPAESPDPPSSRPTFTKGEGTGQHQKASRVKFWIVSAGITLALGGLAIGAFWIGWHMDLGLAPHTQASINARLSVPDVNPPPEETVPINTPSETLAENLAAKEPKVVTLPQTSETEHIAIAPTPTEEGKQPLASGESHDTNASEKVVAFANSLDEEASSITSISVDSDQGDDPVPLESETQEPSIVQTTPTIETSTPTAPSSSTTPPDDGDDSDDTNSFATPLEEEEIIQPDEVMMTSMLTTNLPETPENLPLSAQLETSKPKAPTPPQQQLSPAQQLRDARHLIQVGKYQEASALLSPFFHKPPVNWQPWFWMGTALLGKGDIEKADQFFLSGLARNDKVPQLWIQRALVAQQRGNYQLAIHELRQAESLEPNLPHIHLNMGYAYEQLGNNRLANQYYGKFLKASEGNPEFFSTRKKLFARLTQQTPTVKLSLPPSPKP